MIVPQQTQLVLIQLMKHAEWLVTVLLHVVINVMDRGKKVNADIKLVQARIKSKIIKSMLY